MEYENQRNQINVGNRAIHTNGKSLSNAEQRSGIQHVLSCCQTLGENENKPLGKNIVKI